MCGGGTQTTTTKTEIPPEVMARYNAVNARAEDVANTPFQPYTGEFVAGITPTQQAGINATSQYAQTAQPYFGAGAGLTMQGAQSVGPLSQGQIAYYQNPYTQYVAGATQAALQQQQGQQLSDQQSQAIRSGAFGGDRAGIQRAMLQGQQGLATAQAIAPIYQQGYQQAVQTAQGQQGVVAQDLARQLQAGQQIAGLGTGAQAAALQGAQAQMQAGTLEQQTKQAQDTAVYQQFLQQRGYPFQVAQFLANIAMGTGALSGSTQTTQAPAPFFSDKRLKHDTEKVGEMHDGTPIYRFKYNGSNQTQIGLMAQDVEKRHPEAVGHSQGYKTVDYEKATDEAAHKASGGGLMPNWMGGAVAQPGHYALGGIADTDLAALLSQQQKSFGPFAQNGLYGGTAQGTPYGGQAGIVPAGNLHVSKLLTGSHPQAQKQSSTAGELYSNLKQMDSIASDLTGKGLMRRAGEKTGFWDNPKTEQKRPVVPTDTPVVDPNTIPRTEARGGLIPRGHFSGGGDIVIPGMEDRPEDPGSASGAMGDGLSQVVKAGAAQTPSSLPEPGKPPKSSGQGSNPLGMISSGISAAKGLGSIGSGIGSLATGLGAGAEAAGAAAGAAGAAGGIGSALGSIGTGIAKVLPFLGLALSDERVKHNKREVGKLYDGQPVYSFDYGDGRTQMGLMAQHVERRHPEAVAETDGGLKMVDYHRATEHAADKGHFYSGGLVPPEMREHHDGPNDTNGQSNVVGGGGAEIDPLHPEALKAYTAERAKSYGLDPNFAVKVFGGESGFNPNKPGDENSSFNVPQLHYAGMSEKYPRAGLGDQFTKETGLDARDPKTAREAIDWSLKHVSEDPSRWKNWTVARNLMSNQAAPTPAGGVMPALKSAIKPITGAVQDTGNFISRNKDIILPVLQGLGAMASSPSRYLGSAILQGLGAGAKSYADLQQEQAQTQNLQAQTANTMSNIVGNSFVEGGKFVKLANGRLMPTGKWMQLGDQAPDIFGGEMASQYIRQYLTKYGVPAMGEQPAVGTDTTKESVTPAPAAPAAPAAPKLAPIVPSPESKPAVSYNPLGEASRKLAKEDANNAYGLGGEKLISDSRTYEASVAKEAAAAQENVNNMNELAGLVSKQASQKGFETPGLAFAQRAQVVGAVDTLARALGGEGIGTAKTTADLNDKLQALYGLALSKGADQNTLGALQSLMAAIPSQKMTPDAQATLASQLVVANRASIDRQDHLIRYREDVPENKYVGNLSRASYAFDQDNRVRVVADQQLIKQAILTQPAIMERITTGKMSPEQIETFFHTLARDYKLPYTGSVNRYFQR